MSFWRGTLYWWSLKSISSGTGVKKITRPYVLTSNLISVYQSIVEPYFDNCSIVRNDISDRHTDKLQSLQNRAARVTQVPLYYQLPVNYRGDIEQTWPVQSQGEEKKTNKQIVLLMLKITSDITLAHLDDIFSSNIGKSVYKLRTFIGNL